MKSSESVLAIIPARGGSKGVPRKNVKLLDGKELIGYSIDAALGARHINRVIVSTEDLEIAAVAKRLGAEVPFMRPDELANDKAPTLPVLQSVVTELEKKGERFDVVCLLQPTSPFRTSEDIDAAIQTFFNNDTDSLVSVLPVPHEYNPHWVFKPDDYGRLKIATGESEIVSRRQDLPEAYHRDGSIYLTRREVLMGGSLYGNSISYYVSDESRYVNIDTLKDWEKAERLIQEL